ncbi:hypothetical protein [Sneathiella litorea]|uniref:Uncharacterized protein n=1 Tax=Sneathiella litorea TaxID=2606216 RepID=A0A6L8W5G8_9PROT|nr:hypothetical protein [Sneathiella litorea]MZR29620.1 hypothetical protein [Sneathiella litorea]
MNNQAFFESSSTQTEPPKFKAELSSTKEEDIKTRAITIIMSGIENGRYETLADLGRLKSKSDPESYKATTVDSASLKKGGINIDLVDTPLLTQFAAHRSYLATISNDFASIWNTVSLKLDEIQEIVPLTLEMNRQIHQFSRSIFSDLDLSLKLLNPDKILSEAKTFEELIAITDRWISSPIADRLKGIAEFAKYDDESEEIDIMSLKLLLRFLRNKKTHKELAITATVNGHLQADWEQSITKEKWSIRFVDTNSILISVLRDGAEAFEKTSMEEFLSGENFLKLSENR